MHACSVLRGTPAQAYTPTPSSSAPQGITHWQAKHPARSVLPGKGVPQLTQQGRLVPQATTVWERRARARSAQQGTSAQFRQPAPWSVVWGPTALQDQTRAPTATLGTSAAKGAPSRTHRQAFAAWATTALQGPPRQTPVQRELMAVRPALQLPRIAQTARRAVSYTHLTLPTKIGV